MPEDSALLTDEVLKRLDVLAATVGTTVEQLFEILTYRCRVEGIVSASISALIMLALWIAVIRGVPRLQKADEPELIAGLLIIAPLISIPLLFIFGDGLINALIPEAGAAKELLGILGGR